MKASVHVYATHFFRLDIYCHTIAKAMRGVAGLLSEHAFAKKVHASSLFVEETCIHDHSRGHERATALLLKDFLLKKRTYMTILVDMRGLLRSC
jgi:hypothetical protein